jgi:hypothetical protein
MMQSNLRIFGSGAELPAAIRHEGYAVLSPDGVGALAGVPKNALDPMRPFWARLPPDQYLRDGGRYRRRRHSCWVMDVAAGSLAAVPHRAHWQPVEYNALHGGIERWYEAIEPALCALPSWSGLLLGFGRCFAGVRASARWYIEAHQFRIDTTGGIGRPTPEGAHRDGVDFVSVTVVDRSGVKGGETRVFEAGGPHGLRFTMTEPWSTLLLDDAKVIHETTPIQPSGEAHGGGTEAGGAEGGAAKGGAAGHRDTLVLTYRADGFQGPPRGSKSI